MSFELQEHKIDINGRYILLLGKLDGQQIVLGSVYAPNVDQHLFLETLTVMLTEWENYPWVIGGDFNAVLNVELDRSHPPLQGTTSRKQAEALRNWAEGWNIGDSWRMKHPDSREYSFYSPPHGLHTRLDRIF